MQFSSEIHNQHCWLALIVAFFLSQKELSGSDMNAFRKCRSFKHTQYSLVTKTTLNSDRLNISSILYIILNRIFYQNIMAVK